MKIFQSKIFWFLFAAAGFAIVYFRGELFGKEGAINKLFNNRLKEKVDKKNRMNKGNFTVIGDNISEPDKGGFDIPDFDLQAKKDKKKNEGINKQTLQETSVQTENQSLNA